MCPLFCPRILTTNLEGEDIRHRATINILRIKFYSGPALRTMTSRTAATANYWTLEKMWNPNQRTELSQICCQLFVSLMKAFNKDLLTFHGLFHVGTHPPTPLHRWSVFVSRFTMSTKIDRVLFFHQHIFVSLNVWKNIEFVMKIGQLCRDTNLCSPPGARWTGRAAPCRGRSGGPAVPTRSPSGRTGGEILLAPVYVK